MTYPRSSGRSTTHGCRVSLEKAGIPIWLNAGIVRSENFETGSVHALQDFVEEGKGRMEADLAAIDFLREHYGIWEPKGEVAPIKGPMGLAMREIARRAQAKQ